MGGRMVIVEILFVFILVAGAAFPLYIIRSKEPRQKRVKDAGITDTQMASMRAGFNHLNSAYLNTEMSSINDIGERNLLPFLESLAAAHQSLTEVNRLGKLTSKKKELEARAEFRFHYLDAKAQWEKVSGGK